MGSKSCMNSLCGVSSSPEWKKGWPLRFGEFASLYDRCGHVIRYALCAMPLWPLCAINNYEFGGFWGLEKKHGMKSKQCVGLGLKVRSSLETAGKVPVVVRVGQVMEVNKDTFWPLVKAVGNKTVVLNMYTQWCDPEDILLEKDKISKSLHIGSWAPW
ncbi:hypothetical protein NMG60_11017284 [Bertholletia excelsa]